MGLGKLDQSSSERGLLNIGLQPQEQSEKILAKCPAEDVPSRVRLSSLAAASVRNKEHFLPQGPDLVLSTHAFEKSGNEPFSARIRINDETTESGSECGQPLS